MMYYRDRIRSLVTVVVEDRKGVVLDPRRVLDVWLPGLLMEYIYLSTYDQCLHRGRRWIPGSRSCQ